MMKTPAMWKPVKGPSRRGGHRLVGAIQFAVVVGCVWLAWRVVTSSVADRLPVSMALTIAPGSSTVLSRAAESELAAGRDANAAELGRRALSKAPFNVRALRVVGLAESGEGRGPASDDIITLAADRSLRDDPAHAWLIEQRLRQGNYPSAFAHADTLARRREDIRPRVFDLFTTAAASDPRSFGPLASLLAIRPPWRRDFFEYLYKSPQGLGLAVNLGVALDTSAGRLSDVELQGLYVRLMMAKQYRLMREVRTRLNRPPASEMLVDGSFSGLASPEPFTWRLYPSPGVTSQIIEGSPDGDLALRVQYDGYQSADIAEQLLVLRPGRYRLSGRARTEVGDAGRLGWVVTCRDGPVIGGNSNLGGSRDWSKFEVLFDVPGGCEAQTLKLAPRPGDRRSTHIEWFDDLTVTPAVLPAP